MKQLICFSQLCKSKNDIHIENSNSKLNILYLNFENMPSDSVDLCPQNHTYQTRGAFQKRIWALKSKSSSNFSVV